MKQKTVFIVTAVLLLLVFAGGAVFFNQRKAEQADQAAAHNREVLVRFHSPTEGNASAPVHIVEFFDPACGTCREFYPLVKNMLKDNPGKIQLILRYAPLHPGSDQVVKLLEASRMQGKFWQTLERLLAAQPNWVINHTSRLDLVWGQLDGLNLDMARLKEDMNSPEIARVIDQDVADGKAVNVTATPEYFVNGKPLPSFGYEQLKTLVDDALRTANAG
jgi:protein-disulfide isomerase